MNEVADSLAKRGSLTPALNEPCSFESARRTIRAWETERWYLSWDVSLKGREVWKCLKRPNRADAWWKLRRREQAVLAQFRSGHCPIGAYFGRFRPNYDTRCRNCMEAEETVDHVLYECHALSSLRVGEDGRPFVPCLYGDLSDLRSTATFVLRALRE